MSNPQQLVQKLWNYCNILREDGLSYGDYVEQLTYLLLLKMADEQTKAPFNKPSSIPKEFVWETLIKLDGDDLEIHYATPSKNWANAPACSARSSAKAKNKIPRPSQVAAVVWQHLILRTAALSPR